MTCKKCGRELKREDTGLTRKLISRGATEFYCIPCLAEYFGTTEENCHAMIKRFRADGCTLFN